MLNIFYGIKDLDNSIDYNNELCTILRDLIALKSKRDGKNFTSYQLAKAINMPHSILIKLIHQDPEKRVYNPRIDTLTKIIEFFKSDGFSITIDDLLFGRKEIDIISQPIKNNYTDKNIQIFSLDYEQSKLGTITINLPDDHANIMAYLSEEEINPFFKSGSIFIVNKDMKPENNNLIIIKSERDKKTSIKKLIINGMKRYLMSLNDNDDIIELLPTLHYLIIGVVIQVNAKT